MVFPHTGAEASTNRSGSTLILTVSFILLAGMVTGALISAAVTHRRMADRYYQRERAFHIAEGAFESACQFIADGDGVLPAIFHTNGVLGGGQFHCTIRRTSDFSFAISATGVAGNVRWVVEAGRVEQPSWARYALWMDTNGRIYFIGGEEFFGHVHSNSRLYFDNTGGDGADFYDRCTSTENRYGGDTNGATFAYGLELNTDQDSMASVNFTSLYNKAVSVGLVVTGHTFVTLSGGVMRVTNQRQGWTNHTLSVDSNSLVYIASTDDGASSNRAGRLTVSGQVDGRITFVTDDDILLPTHLTYALHPSNAASDDAVGLVSRDDIWVDTTMPDNAQIHAAMMATGRANGENGSFGVVDYGSGSPRGNLNVWGSIVQEVRGAVGTFSGSGPATGYSKRYRFDRRFQTLAPPHYPRLATKLNISGWREGPGS
jgi:hypothetical protein